MRATTAERSAVVSLLEQAHVDGRIGLETFEWRLHRAFRVRHDHELAALVDDLAQQPGIRELLRERWRVTVDRLREWLTPPKPAPTVTVPFPPRVDGKEYLVGRAPRCDLVVDDPTVSRVHASLTWRDGAWLLRDLGSRNGTTVDGWRIDEAVLEGQRAVQLGAAVLTLVDPDA